MSRSCNSCKAWMIGLGLVNLAVFASPAAGILSWLVLIWIGHGLKNKFRYDPNGTKIGAAAEAVSQKYPELLN
jgi:hypothetical protein